MLNLAEAPVRLIAERFAPSLPQTSRRNLRSEFDGAPRHVARAKDQTGRENHAQPIRSRHCGRNCKSTIWRAIKTGRISATRTYTGTYEIDPAELFRVFPATPKDGDLKQAATAIAPVAMAALEAQIGALNEVSGLLKEQLEDIRKDRDA